ncbi:MAG: ferredoxin [Candidatus Ranarchaeia archaeon]
MSENTVKVNVDLCIACGTCYEMCPDFFTADDEGKSHVMEEYQTSDDDLESIGDSPDDQIDCVTDAKDSCPVEAIFIGEE